MFYFTCDCSFRKTFLHRSRSIVWELISLEMLTASVVTKALDVKTETKTEAAGFETESKTKAVASETEAKAIIPD